MRFATEEVFLDEVQKCLEENDCKVWREIVPDQCVLWEKPRRVDMIFYRGDIGYKAVEGKNLRISQGARVSEAIDQVKTYQQYTYFGGEIIDDWSLAFPNDSVNDERAIVFIKNFIKKRYNITVLEYFPKGKWWTARVTIDRNCPGSIKFGGVNTYGKRI